MAENAPTEIGKIVDYAHGINILSRLFLGAKETLVSFNMAEKEVGLKIKKNRKL